MRLRNTVVLAILFILLGAYIYFFELQKETSKKTERLLSFKEEEVQGVVLNYPDREIRLQRDARGRWRLVYPLEAAADDSSVGAILSALSAGEVKRAFEEKPSRMDLQDYGLDKPEVKVSITLRNGTALPPILIGARTPVGNSVYVRRGADGGVILTDASIRANLAEKELYNRLNKQLADFLEEEKK